MTVEQKIKMMSQVLSRFSRNKYARNLIRSASSQKKTPDNGTEEADVQSADHIFTQ